jgi:hypothetical protein
VKFYKRMEIYFRHVIWRELPVALLLLLFGGFFFGLFHVLSNGIWDAQKRPSHLVAGKILSIGTEVGFQSNLDPRSYIRVQLANGGRITLREKYRLVADCKPGDSIQVRTFVDESADEFYQLGKKRCWSGETNNAS